VSQNGVGASQLAARHPVRAYGGHDREPTVVWGTTCQGPELILREARSEALILMGDWCGSDRSWYHWRGPPGCDDVTRPAQRGKTGSEQGPRSEKTEARWTVPAWPEPSRWATPFYPSVVGHYQREPPDPRPSSLRV